MKKLIIYSLVGVITLATSTSCNTYHSINDATSVSQLSANPFMQNVAKSVIKNMATNLVQNGITNMEGKLNLGTNLNSILTTAQAITGFKNMLSSNYNIGSSLVESNFSKLGTIGDVVGFVAKNGSGFKF